MSRNNGRLWIVACVAALVLAPMAVAQDMTGGMVTDPPAPVADGYATFTGWYQNLGPGPAVDMNVTYDFPIQQQTWPPESDGFNLLMESTIGTDTNGNDASAFADVHPLLLVLQMPNDTGDHAYPIASGVLQTIISRESIPRSSRPSRAST
jgi:hypothetical protein